MPPPLFLANRLTIEPLGGQRQHPAAAAAAAVAPASYAVYDHQLRDHFVTATADLYACECLNHKHNAATCSVVTERECARCQRATVPLLTRAELLFHHSALTVRRLMRCCRHVHTPPCGRCINCRVEPLDELPAAHRGCVVRAAFECDVSTEAVCAHASGPTFTRDVLRAQPNLALHEHMYDVRRPEFFFCHRHRHTHRDHPGLVCYIWAGQACCDQARSVRALTESFVVFGTNSHLTTNAAAAASAAADSTAADAAEDEFDKPPVAKRARRSVPAPSAAASAAAKPAEPVVLHRWVVYSPAIWRDQACNHFMSFVRACVVTPEVAPDRFQRFADAAFYIPLKQYVSGKDSFVRSAVTGFNTDGVYQTATISCLQRYDVVMLPQNLYDMLAPRYDLSLVMLKRDPSLNPNCQYTLRAVRNPDPTITVVTISDQISKGLNQDQDGDRDAIYLVPTRRGPYDATQTTRFLCSRFERAQAFRNRRTVVARPRFRLSETGRLETWRNRAWLAERCAGYARVSHLSCDQIDDAFAGYLADWHEPFQQLVRDLLRTSRPSLVTAADLLLETDRLRSVYASGTKGNRALLEMLVRKLRAPGTTPAERLPETLALHNKYVRSNRELSRSGRRLFVLLFSAGDLVQVLDRLYLCSQLMAYTDRFDAGGLAFFAPEVDYMLLVGDLVRSAIREGLFADEPPGLVDALLAGLYDHEPADGAPLPPPRRPASPPLRQQFDAEDAAAAAAAAAANAKANAANAVAIEVSMG